MKNQRGFEVIEIIFIVALVLGFLLGGYYLLRVGLDPDPVKTPVDSTQVDQSAGGDYGTVSGEVVSIDMSGQQTDRDGVYVVKLSDGTTYGVLLPARKALCDEAAVNVSSTVKVGAKVDVRGKLRDKTLRVCDAGTYLRPAS